MDVTKKYQSLQHFLDLRHPRWMDIGRIVLGIAIFIKGIYFISDHTALQEILSQSRISGWAFIVEHHVAFTYLVGGILISIGLLTRVALVFQIPVFFGAIFCCLTNTGFFSVFSDLTFSFIVFVLVIAYLFIGPGNWSVDWYMKNAKDVSQY